MMTAPPYFRTAARFRGSHAGGGPAPPGPHVIEAASRGLGGDMGTGAIVAHGGAPLCPLWSLCFAALAEAAKSLSRSSRMTARHYARTASWIKGTGAGGPRL